MLIGVGASTCASGSHVCTGTAGTLIRKPAISRMKKVLARPPASTNFVPRYACIAGRAARIEIRADQDDEQADRADERVEKKFDGRVLFPRAAPDADQEIHRQ